MTRPPADLPERTRADGSAEPPIDRDERRIRIMAESIETTVASGTDRDREARAAALRTLLDYGEVVSAGDATLDPR